MYMTRKWETPTTALLPELRLKTCDWVCPLCGVGKDDFSVEE